MTKIDLKHNILFAVIPIITLCLFSCSTKYLVDSRDGQKYRQVKIANQVWMVDNLAYIPDSSVATYIESREKWKSLSDVDKAYCFYKNDLNSACLYNWEAAKVVCPSGWHLPTEGEWRELSLYLRADYSKEDKKRNLKNIILARRSWIRDVDLTEPIKGCRSSDGGFYKETFNEQWWSSSLMNEFVYIYTWDQLEYRFVDSYFVGNVGFSIRCLKN